MSRGKIVVDGSNVAFEEQTAEGKPRMGNLVAMRRELVEVGYEPIIIVDAALRHAIDDRDQLEALLDEQIIHPAPAGTDADTFVLLEAGKIGSQVVSNDVYEPFRDEYPWIEERRMPYMIITGRVLLPKQGPH